MHLAATCGASRIPPCWMEAEWSGERADLPKSGCMHGHALNGMHSLCLEVGL